MSARSSILVPLVLLATGAGAASADLFGLQDAEGGARSSVEATPGPPLEHFRQVLAEAHAARDRVQAVGELLPVPGSLRIDGEAWVARAGTKGRPMTEREPQEDGSTRLRVNLTRVGPIYLPGGPGHVVLAPLSPEAGDAAANDMGIFGRSDDLRRELAAAPGPRAQLVLARRTALGDGPAARLPGAPEPAHILVAGVAPAAPALAIPLVKPTGRRDAYWHGDGRPRSEAEYRRAVRTTSGWNLLFDKVDLARHPWDPPPSPAGLELSPAAFEALGLVGDVAWVVWWTSEPEAL